MTVRASSLAVAAAALAAALALPCSGGRCFVAARAQEEASAARTFHFGEKEKHVNITFVSETSVETINGITHQVSGTADLDMEKGEGSAELKVPVASMDTGIPLRNEHMRSKDWLDAANHPDIVFTAKSLKRTKKEEKKETWSYEGEIAIHGVTKPLKGEATVIPIPAAAAKVLGEGTWVKVKARFEITIADFGIKVPEMAAAKVSPTWEIAVDVFGTTAAPDEK